MFSLHISKAKPNTRVYVSALYDWVEAAVFSLICVVVVFTFFFRIVGVDGKSMNVTLMHKDRLILASAFYTPKHGDIVVINRICGGAAYQRVCQWRRRAANRSGHAYRPVKRGRAGRAVCAL